MTSDSGVPESVGTLRSERKVITALFADIVGSTVIGEKFDPEDAREIITPAISLMVKRVEEFGGMVKDLAGDGMLALFGAHEAHEDDPERAIQAGLAIVADIQDYAKEVEKRWGIAGFGVRLGAETGLAVLGMVGAGARVEYGATGDVVNTAARLQSHAQPFSVLVGPNTYEAAEPIFTWGEPTELELKGKAEPVTAYAVIARREQAGKVRGFSGLNLPLFGRETEWGIIAQRRATLEGGTGSVIFLIGEPGIGKSRLLEELKKTSPATYSWLEGRCVSYGRAIPYWPFRDLLRAWVGVSVLDGQSAAVHKLQQRCHEVFGADAAQHRPLLASILALPLDPDEAAQLAELSPEARQYRTAQALLAVLEKESEAAPVICVIDDIHWIDESSLQVLERLSSLVAVHPVLLCIAQRPERDQPSWQLHIQLQNSMAERTSTMELEHLPPDMEDAMLDALIGATTLPAGLHEQLIERASGNPFYLEELVRSLIESGAVVQIDSGWEFKGAEDLQLPPSLERVIISRLDRLSAHPREVVQTASVLGRVFGYELISAITGGNGTISQALRELADMELLVEESNNLYRFRHALIQETAYNNLLKRERKDLHARAAVAIETVLSDQLELNYGVLGHHYRAAEKPDPALRYFQLAAQGAQKVYAVDAAIENYTAALEMAQQIESPLLGRLRLQVGRVRSQAGRVEEARADLEEAMNIARLTSDDGLEARAMTEFGSLLAGAVDYQEALPVLEQAREKAHSAGIDDAEAAAATRLSIVYTNLTRFDLAIERARSALDEARKTHDDAATAMALDALQVASVLTGDMPTVTEISPELIDLQRRRGDLWYLQWATFQRAWVDFAAGRWADAERWLGDAATISASIDDRVAGAIHPAFISWIARVQGEFQRAWRLANEAVELAEATGHVEFISFNQSMLAWLLEDLGDYERADGYWQQSLELSLKANARIEIFRAAGHCAFMSALMGRDDVHEHIALTRRYLAEISAPPGYTYMQGADAVVKVGRALLMVDTPEVALEVIEPVLASAVKTEWREMETELHIVRGEALAKQGDADGAKAEFAHAVDLASRFGMPAVELRAQSRLARSGDETAGHRGRELLDSLGQRIDDAHLRTKFQAAMLAELGG